MMDILRIEHLKKSFGNHTVLDGVDLCVPQHSIFGFIGENGSGKTTTMRLILGLLKCDEGLIQVMGKPVTYGQNDTNRYIGYVSDVPEFYGFMTPLEYLKLCGEITNMPKEGIRIRCEELLDLAGLTMVKNKRIQGFSRGMKQRLGIASALLNEPKLLICDEPTSALDPIGRKEILDMLSKVKEHTTVLFSTHILNDVERICDEIAILHKGKIIIQDQLEHLKAQKKASALVITFLNQSDLKRFLHDVDHIAYKQKDTHTLQMFADDIYALQGEILTYLHYHLMLVSSLVIEEPTLEDIFMEVIS